MRKVYSQSKSQDRSPGQRKLREQFETDFKSFHSQLVSLEKAHLAGRIKLGDVKSLDAPDQKALVVADERTETLETLIETMLGEAPT